MAPSASTPKPQNQGTGIKDWWFRHALALTVVIASIVAIAVTAFVAIRTASDQEQSETTRLVFVSILPLFGTWVGTVLAYYFARENMREATTATQASVDATARLAGIWKPETLVKDVMQPENRIERHTLDASAVPPETPKGVSLRKLWDLLEGRPFDRAPIVDRSKVVRAILRRQDLTDWGSRQNGSAPGVYDNAVVGDLRPTQTELDQLIKAFATVTQDTTLGAARDKLASLPGAKTIIVTTDGTDQSALVGLLTDTDLVANLG